MRQSLLAGACLLFLSHAACASVAIPQGNVSIGKGGTGATTAVNALTNLDQVAAQSLPHLRAKLAAVRAGQADATILVIGDSTSFCSYANGAGSGDYKTNCWVSQLARNLDSMGIPAEWNNWFGDGMGGTQIAYDPRITLSSQWIDGATGTSLGGDYITAGSTAGTNNGAISFRPAYPVNTAKVYYLQSTDSRTMNWNVDGGSTTSFAELGDGSHKYVSSTTFALGSLGLHTFNVTWGSGGNANVVGMDAYNSTIHQVHLLNAAWRASKASNWDDATYNWSPLNAIASVAPDACIIDETVNDWNAGTSLSTYAAQIQALITACQASGDVILATGNPSDPTQNTPLNASLATQQTYVNQIYALAASQTNPLPVVDIWTRFGSWAAANTQGLMASDGQGLHPNGTGYNDIAEAWGSLFRAFGSGSQNSLYVAGAVGIGTAQPQVGFDNNLGKMLVHGGSAPTISACGTSAAVAGSDSSFTLTVGSSATTSCVVNFGSPWTLAPQSCQLMPTNATAAATGTTGAYVGAISTTQLTITGLALTNAHYNVVCF